MYSLECHWSPGMLLSPPPCQQSWRTTKILCTERHRSGHQTLERQTSPSTSTSSSSIAFGSKLATEIEEHSYLTCGPDATSQHFTPTTFNKYCLHEVPISHGQPLQPQGDGYPLADSEAPASTSQPFFDFSIKRLPSKPQVDCKD